jgi:ribosome maturation factor RimP
MADSSIAKIKALLANEISALGYELWGITRVSQDKQSILRIFIEKPEGVTVQDCTLVTRRVGALLDLSDVMKSAYRLEVSSPGMDRILFELAHYQRFIGHKVKLKLYTPIEDRRNITGTLSAANEQGIVVVDDEQQALTLRLADIERANLLPQY